MAQANFQRAGLADRITVHQGPALESLERLAGPFDLIFLDADRPNYAAYLEPLLLRLRPRGLLVTDNVVSHAEELVEFLRRVKTDPALESVTVPLGNGQELTCKRR